MTTESEGVIFRKLDELKEGVVEISVRLARMESHDDRLKELERQVLYLRLDRAKFGGIVAAGSFLGGVIVTLAAKLLGW